MSRPLSKDIAPHLPYLRRYARALAGSQQGGDAYVRACLEILIADPDALDPEPGVRVGLYRLFARLWNQLPATERGDPASPFEARAHERLASLTPGGRQLLLLTRLEDFTIEEAAAIVGQNTRDATAMLAETLEGIERQIASRILIVEDEPIIALDLAGIVEGLGHEVIDIARTADEAVKGARAGGPGLVLADIQLADGSSGIDAAEVIMSETDAPVIFITAFPERLLTGERREPTYLITKPYDPVAVKTAISQALFLNSAAAIAL